MPKELTEAEQEIHALAEREGITRAAAANRLQNAAAAEVPDTELDDQ